MAKRNSTMPCCVEYDATEDGRYSNGRNHSNGYSGNDKGHANPEHEDSRKWSEKQAAETGLTDREKL